MATKRIPKKISKKIKEFTATLDKDKLPIQEVYLFGSYAKGTSHKWSDIDICVISPRFTDPWDAMQYLWHKRPPINDAYEPPIEPIGFSPKDFYEGGTLINEIKRHGIKII